MSSTDMTSHHPVGHSPRPVAPVGSRSATVRGAPVGVSAARLVTVATCLLLTGCSGLSANPLADTSDAAPVSATVEDNSHTPTPEEPAAAPALTQPHTRVPEAPTSVDDTPATTQPSGTKRQLVHVPSVAGKSLDDAQTRLKEAGLESRSVVYQEGAPITEQWPQAGSRVPNTLTVELWVGKPDVTPDVFGNTPPTEAPQLAANDADTSNADTDSSASDGNGRDNTEPGGSDSNPNTSQTPEPGPTVPPQRPVAQAAPSVGTRYVLPPPAEHGARVNPRYRPAVPVGTQLTGPASWYGPKFHGLGDACGTVFNQHAATIATRELRCGTVVRITGPNGTVDAVVTDWGPAEWTGRRFDLSKATFNAIAPLGAGVVNVSMVTLNEPS